ncbi:MAG: hypothetical protein LBT56_06480 [Prevotellaceae bacterium]|jgi:hypothetical protein|nr:hypothetical protein [Prevotellaceae bacterium]
MKIKKLIILTLLTVAVVAGSCKYAASKQAETVESDAIETTSVGEDYLIKESSAGQFTIGQQIPFADNIQKKYLTRITEEGESEEPIYVVTENGQGILHITPEYDYETETFNNKIGEIIVLSDKFKTTAGIGVNSTIEEFVKKYPDFSVWYTYVSDTYVIETGRIDNVQFILDESDFKGKLEISDEITTLKLSDFKPNTKIIQIRII